MLVGISDWTGNNTFWGLPVYVKHVDCSPEYRRSRSLSFHSFASNTLSFPVFSWRFQIAFLVRAKMLELGVLAPSDYRPTMEQFRRLYDWWVANNRRDFGVPLKVPGNIRPGG